MEPQMNRRGCMKGCSSVALGIVMLAIVAVGVRRLIFRPCSWDWLTPGAYTKCASGFSEREFNRIAVGSSRDDVERRLGLPLRITEDSGGRILRQIDWETNHPIVSYPDLPRESGGRLTGRTFFYTLPGDTESDWYVRAIILGPDSNVKQVYKTLHFD